MQHFILPFKRSTNFNSFYRNSNATFYAAQRGFGMYQNFVEHASMMFESMTCQGNETDIGYCKVSYNTSSCGGSNNVPVGIDCSGRGLHRFLLVT